MLRRRFIRSRMARAIVGGAAGKPGPSSGYEVGVHMGALYDWANWHTVDLFDQAREWAQLENPGNPGQFPAVLNSAHQPSGSGACVISAASWKTLKVTPETFKLRVNTVTQPALDNVTLSQAWASSGSGSSTMWECQYQDTGSSTPTLRVFSEVFSRPKCIPIAEDWDTHKKLRADAMAHFKRFRRIRLNTFYMPSGQSPDWVTWSQRAQPGSIGIHKSFEFLIAVANELYTEPGSRVVAVDFAIPHRFDQTATTNLAVMVRDTMNPALVWHTAYGNECWNTIYNATQWLLGRRNDTNDPDYTRVNTGNTIWGPPDEYDRYARLWGLEAARRAAWVRAAAPTKWGVTWFNGMEGHDNNPSWHTVRMMPWLEMAAQTSEFGAVNTWAHELRCGGYVQGDPPEYEATRASGDPGAAMVAVLRTSGSGAFENAAHRTAWAAWVGMKATYGIPRVYMYEWGQHMWSAPHADLGVLMSNNAGMKTLYEDMCRYWYANGISGGNFYDGSPSKHVAFDVNSQWGAGEYFGHDAAPELAGLLQIVSEE